MSFVSSGDCLSVLELLALKETGDEAAAAHVATCHRCQALLRTLRDADQTVIVSTGGGKTHLAHVREPADGTDVRPGAVWVATGDEPGWTEVVAVVGRSRRDPRSWSWCRSLTLSRTERISTSASPMSSSAIRRKRPPWNFGWLYAEQLIRPVGEIDDSLRGEITGLSDGWLVGAVAERPDNPHAGCPALGGANDRRQLRREQEREQLLRLWRQVDRDRGASR